MMRAVLLFVLVLGFESSAAAAELELRYYGAEWCAPCHVVEPMVDRWAAANPDLRLVKLDYDASEADRLRFDLVGVPMLVLLKGDDLVGKYGDRAQRVADFAPRRLDGWYQSVRDKVELASQ
jgi:thiol-disulfide isomerase/thioredoxin